MSSPRANLMSRALGRVQRISRRAGERVRGLPLRATQRKLGLRVPPGRLIHLVANTEDVAWFLDTGALAAKSIRDVLGQAGVRFDELGSILDFGCGVGRVMRQWDGVRGPQFHGTDYNRDLVTWCKANLPFAKFQVNELDKPLAYGDRSFDLIYCLSVFTHLDQALESFWMEELSRLIKPGGYLLITTHGDHYLGQLSAADQAAYKSGHVVVQKAQRGGSNDCATFHPESYVRGKLASGFEVVRMIPEGALGNPRQDLYLLRKPS